MLTFFELQANRTNVKTEALAGATTFLAMMYIIVVNPAILSAAGLPFAGVLTATVLCSALSSILMGLYANNPIALAPGMGLNAFFTYTVVLGLGLPWATALGTVFWSGVIFVLLSAFNVRTLIVHAIPRQLRYAVAAGIGLFISFIGFVNAGFIVPGQGTPVQLGPLSAVTITFAVGLLVTALLVARRLKGALVLGIVCTTLLALPVGRLYGDATALTAGLPTLVSWRGLFAPPDFSLLLALDFVGSLAPALWSVTFAFLFTDMFDSLSTFVGVAEAADLLDADGEPLRIKRSLIVDGLATLIAGLVGSSSGTAYIESATGIEEGGRTGLTAVVTGALFVPFMFLSPLLSVVPAIATAPALVLVGVFMMRPVLSIRWSQLDDAIPAFFAMVLIPLTYSITQGIIWGFLSFTAIKLATGKRSELSPTLLAIDAFSLLALAV